ncbi:hypothetical protein JD844_016445 [Phrynosoma platyrhinos]|uniref:Piezo-type mechanosensitive ion channel component n=1 Tax=Phrynosoma platyrhinos TaxID=52577 RepID=A0ABQ7SKE6_PHRPL|nr:hypothetical protein JD844_016445 [Phrynosoma platyrhinos]
MLRDRRKYAMISSPFMVMYGNLLLTLQYIWSIELNDDELPEVSGFLEKKAPTELASKILFAITFWLLLRQHLTEQKALRLKEAVLSEVKVDEEEESEEKEEPPKDEEESTKEEEEEEEESEEEEDIMKVLGNLVMAMFIKYWIYVCGGMFFFVSFEGKIVMYKIIYMMLFLFCVVLYQLTDLKAIISKQDNAIYSIKKKLPIRQNELVHQDGSLPDITMMISNTNTEKEEENMLQDQEKMPQEQEASVIIRGEREHEEEGNEKEEEEVDEEDEDDESETEEISDLRNKWHLVIDRLTVLFLKFLECFHKLQVFVWWILELHIIKIVSLLNYVFLIAWAFALPYSQFRPLASSVCTVWTCVIIICKMLYQLESINTANFSVNCTMPNTTVKQEGLSDSLLYRKPIDPTEWVGLKKSNPLLVYLRNNLLMLAILAFEVTIYRHQEYYRCRNNLTAPETKTIFHDITRLHLDDGVISCLKYFINYFFYKFGLESCFLLSVNVIGQRMDFYAMIHAFALIAVLYRRRRKAIAEVWPKYCCFLACIITFQYFICIGIPPAPCKDYPWRSPNANFNSNIIKWLYFPDFIQRPNPVFLVYDFMLLLCASLQRQTFEDENKAAVRIMAGDNVEICMNLDAASFSQHNPVPDFIHCRMDRIKARQQKYKKGKERVMSMNQEASDGQAIQKEDDDDDGEADKEKAKGKKKQWWRPWVDHASSRLKKEMRINRAIAKFASAILALPKSVIKLPKTILQYLIRAAKFVYQAWITDPKTALRQRRKEKKKYEKERRRRRKGSGDVSIDVECDERDETVKKKSDGPDNIIKRIYNILKFTWVLFLATIDSFTAWLNSISREHIDISTVLRIERCMLTREIKKGNVPTRESIHMYYQNHMMKLSRESGLDEIYEPGQAERTVSLESAPSRDSETSEATQITMLYSRQGTAETIEEVEGEEHEEEGADPASRQEHDMEDYCLDSEGAAYTSDTDMPSYSALDGIADPPPSYSKVVSLELLPLDDSQDGSSDKNQMMVSPDENQSNRPEDSILPPLTHELTASELLMNKMFQDEELDESEKFYADQPRFLLLIYALYNTLVARSEMVCYFVIILNHMISASMITLVLPILIFLWAMLSVPRPSKRFWMTAIVYTECHGLWDDEDGGDNGSNKDDSDDELCESDRRGSSDSLQSVNLATSVESIHVHFPEQHSAVRRKSSSSGSQLSHRSSFSSHRSKRGSTSTRNSSQKGSSVLSIKQKSRKELLMEKLREQMIIAKAFTIKKTLQVYVPIKQFFYNLIHPDYSAVTDVYVLMFLADTVDFIIIVFGFGAFGKHSAAADITSSLSEDQVPQAFLVMVLIQFGTMVVDRALYLRKTVMGKVIFQVILVFGIHFWMFFILPMVTERKFSKNTVAQLWYFVKCVYFGLSAYQIRCGYPTRVLGNFLTKSYNYVNLFLFQGFRLVPFLTELRAVMDWVWTDTTLSLSSWICVEDIYAHIFILKCWRESEKRYPQPRGQKKKKAVKYGMGGMIIVLLICIVWFPLLFMSLIKSVAGVINKPLDVSITITLGGYQPIFTMSAQQSQLRNMSGKEYGDFLRKFKDNAALQFLENYGREDITVAQLEGSSNSLWTISPPSRENMIKELKAIDSDFSLVISWTVQRILKEVYPHYIKAPSDSLAKPIKQLLKDGKDENITVSLSNNNNSDINSDLREWWVLNQTNKILDKNKTRLELVVFSDKVSPPSLGFLAGYGIMGLYASVVLVIGKFVREFFSGISHSIMFEELPNVDRILKLCTDIFLVRETGELELEEDLYAKLIFLYRSPETMIKWTREKTN